MERNRNRRQVAAAALGAVDDGAGSPRPGMRVPAKTPDGKVVDLTIREMFLECCYAGGLSKRQAEAMWVRGKSPQTDRPPVDVSDDARLVALLDEKIDLVALGIDALVVRQGNIHQLAAALNILIEKRQLLRGKPTNIISIEDRRAIQEVGQRLIEEMKRRGMVQPEMKDVTPK